jgi:outer membrane protein OmpA-like peptidoglycan-associated protein
MSQYQTRFAALLFLALMGAGSVLAQGRLLTADDFLEMLENKGAVPNDPRSPVGPAQDSLLRDRSIVEDAGGRAGRGESLGSEERGKLADILHRPGYASVDLEVYFDFNSAAIMGQSARILLPLAEALRNDRLSSSTFMIAGHTHGKGSADYNQRLSERRAQAIRQFLLSASALSPTKLIPVGYGMEELKNRRDPLAAENRRVQIVNLTR